MEVVWDAQVCFPGEGSVHVEAAVAVVSGGHSLAHCRR